MQLAARVSAGDQLEEGQKLAMAMPGMTGIGDPPGGDLQRGKQRRRAWWP
jgi:hypothetical protein